MDWHHYFDNIRRVRKSTGIGGFLKYFVLFPFMAGLLYGVGYFTAYMLIDIPFFRELIHHAKKPKS